MTSQPDHNSTKAIVPPGREWLCRIAAWADALAAPDFDFGHWDDTPRQPDGAYTMPYFIFSPAAHDFLSSLVVSPNFDWPAWADSAAGHRLREPAAVAGASPEDLVRLMTVLKRADRFSEGTLAHAFETGLLRAIVDRAAALCRC